VLLAVVVSINVAFAQAENELRAAPDSNVLDSEQWERLDTSIERGLASLISKQKADGSFDAIEIAQPGITSLGLMAFLAQGESPIDGKFQEELSKAVTYIADQQKANGLIVIDGPNAVPIPRQVRANAHKDLGSIVVYNHAISALALAEAYGQCSPEQAEQLAPVIEKAIAATLEMQQWGAKKKHDVGGWRYIDKRFSNGDSDLSATGWQLMFLRSARNAGFEVEKEYIDMAVAYVERCFLNEDDRKVHSYLVGGRRTCTRATAGAGVLALAHAGKNDSQEAISSAEWILKHDFSNYNDDTPVYGLSWCEEHYHYASFICSQAMFQIGGKYWKQFYPPLVDTLLANQQADGAWPPEKAVPQYGSCYSTSLCILSMSVPNQMLPIFQR